MEKLRVMTCDHLNLARSKYLAMAKADAGVTRMCQGIFALTYKRDLLPAPGSQMLEGLPDLQVRWDKSTVRDGWHDGVKIVIGDYYSAQGQPLPLCGRGALKRAVSQWQAMGYSAKVGIELEAYAFVYGDDGQLQPLSVPGSFVYATGPHADPIGFSDAIWQAAHRAQLPLELITSEYDAAQFEFVLSFGDAVAAVDNIFLFKQLAREVALDYGVVLSFMPKPIAELGGNGVHVNFSFTDKSGNNVIATGDVGGPEHMSQLAQACVAGLMQHHKALAGITAPSVNSYARLQPASMAGYWQNWGGDHRSVTARVSSEGGNKARIEHRMPDSAANPYTTTAAVLQAALLGVINKYQLPPAESGDGFENISTEVGVGADLAAALSDLEADTAFSQALGQELVDNHLFIKRAEIQELAACTSAEEQRDYYIHFI